jgi:GntR family transcriptional repressor for pyruvate dehydrogenase complex
MLDQPRHSSAADACFQQLRRAIVSGQPPPGQHLPPERELALTLGVNRTTLRSALTRLDAAGLIVARQGAGTLVRDFRRAAGLELLPELLAQTADVATRRLMFDDLLLMRRQMASAVLARLVAGVSQRARADVAAAVAAMAQTLETKATSMALAEADLAVLAAVLDATQSPVFALCLNPVSETLRRSADLRAAMYAEPQANLAGWLALCDWLAAPDPALIPLILAQIDERDAATLARLSPEEK